MSPKIKNPIFYIPIGKININIRRAKISKIKKSKLFKESLEDIKNGKQPNIKVWISKYKNKKYDIKYDLLDTRVYEADILAYKELKQSHIPVILLMK